MIWTIDHHDHCVLRKWYPSRSEKLLNFNNFSNGFQSKSVSKYPNLRNIKL